MFLSRPSKAPGDSLRDAATLEGVEGDVEPEVVEFATGSLLVESNQFSARAVAPARRSVEKRLR